MRVAVLLLLVATQASAEEPALRRIVLSSGGVGQFEFEADVTSAATLQLDIPLDQVDDVLKSLTIDDEAGPARSVRLPGQQPLSESFRTLPFKQEAFASAESLLAGLVGERVRLPSIGATGAILAVSAFEVPAGVGTPMARHRLTIATDDGIVSAVLEDTPDIAFSSDTLRAQIATALAAIAAQRVQDRRTLTITLADGPARRVRFAYVVSVPVWEDHLPHHPAGGCGQARAAGSLRGHREPQRAGLDRGGRDANLRPPRAVPHAALPAGVRHPARGAGGGGGRAGTRGGCLCGDGGAGTGAGIPSAADRRQDCPSASSLRVKLQSHGPGPARRPTTRCHRAIGCPGGFPPRRPRSPPPPASPSCCR